MTAPAYTWDPKRRVFLDKRGKVVAAAALLLLRDGIADQVRADAQALTAAYFTGSLTLPDWAEQFAKLIRAGMTAAFLLGKGGANTAKPGDDAALATVMHPQLDAARGLTTALAATMPPPVLVNKSGATVDPNDLAIDEDTGEVVDQNGDPVTSGGVSVSGSALDGIMAAMGAVAALIGRSGSYESGVIAGYSAGQSCAWGDAELPELPPEHPGCRCSTHYDVDENNQVIGSWDSMAGACEICVVLDAQYTDYETGVYVTDGGDIPSD